MTTSRRSQGAVLLLLAAMALLGRPALAVEREGNLMGWVEDSQGSPVAGAVVSLFGKGIGRGGLTTLSDSAGRFFLPSLPAGSYTLRALGRGHEPAPAREITVLPDQDSVFSVSLARLGDLSEAEAVERTRELRWLLRHKRRSVLETQTPVVFTGRDEAPRGSDLLDRAAPVLSSLAGSLEVVANPAALGAEALADDAPSSRSVVKFRGRLAGLGRWSLGGLVSESESANWRMAAEFVIDPGGGHELEAGAGYGSQMLRPGMPGPDGRADSRGIGALFAEDRWDLGSVSASVGGRYTFVGYLRDANHLDPRASIELRPGSRTTVRGTVLNRTLLPGGDLLTLSSLATGPALSLAVMDQGLRPERIVRYELVVDRALGAGSLSAHTFYEGVRDQLVNTYEGPGARSLRIFNTRGLAARGVGVTLARRFGTSVQGSVTYTYGRSWRERRLPGDDLTPIPHGTGDFHDIVTRLETAIERSDTHLLVLYRINTLSPEDVGGIGLVTSSRFDVQLRQGLPFLGDLTRADWELLLAYRNLFYEASDSGVLDELMVSNPPRRVLGGISVRF